MSASQMQLVGLVRHCHTQIVRWIQQQPRHNDRIEWVVQFWRDGTITARPLPVDEHTSSMLSTFDPTRGVLCRCITQMHPDESFTTVLEKR